MKYVPRNPPDLRQELERLRQVLDGPTLGSLRLDVRYSAPQNPVAGMIVYADGTSWDPGSGEGIYAYYGSAWNLLG